MDTSKLAAIYWLSKLTDRVLVGISGGKDSIAALDVCHRAGLKCTGYFMYMVKGLEYQTSYLDTIKARYKIDILEYPHPDRITYFNEGRYCVAQSLPKISFRDVWDAARKDTGLEWLVTGEKKRDSLERRAQLTSWGAVQPARRHGFPLSEWSNNEVYEYLEKHGIPLAPEYAYLGKSFGSPLEGRALDFIKTNYPNDFATLSRDFPFAMSSLVRYYNKPEDDK